MTTRGTTGRGIVLMALVAAGLVALAPSALAGHSGRLLASDVSGLATPKNLTPPTIAGKPAVDETLTCDPGTWQDAESFAYHWNRDDSPISGAATATYVVPAGDVGHALTCTVTATGDGGSTAATSAEVTVVRSTPTGPLPGPCANAEVGTAGADAMRGTEFGDLLFGLAGRDRLVGLVGSDCLVGGPGRDWLAGGDGPDELEGGKSADRLHGGHGRDKVRGGQGADILTGGAGMDRLVAGPGNDTLDALDGKADVVRCGAGDDIAVVDAKDQVSGCEDVREHQG
jgi:Ca2+-binding RTX toxin-like protein